MKMLDLIKINGKIITINSDQKQLDLLIIFKLQVEKKKLLE